MHVAICISCAVRNVAKDAYAKNVNDIIVNATTK